MSKVYLDIVGDLIVNGAYHEKECISGKDYVLMDNDKTYTWNNRNVLTRAMEIDRWPDYEEVECCCECENAGLASSMKKCKNCGDHICIECQSDCNSCGLCDEILCNSCNT